MNYQEKNSRQAEIEQDLIDKFQSDFAAESFSTRKSEAQSFWKELEAAEALFTSGAYKTFNDPHVLENMLALYVLNNEISSMLRDILRGFGMPKSTIAKSDISILDGFVAKDGTLYAFSKYCQLDPLWLLVLVYYFWYKYIHPGGVHPFITEPTTSPIQIIEPSATIAILGDWGTGAFQDGKEGKCPAELVIDGIVSLDPDYIIHLGDGYYAETEKEEQQNLLDILPDHLKGKLYTMNSNHEMYDGANGLFNTTISNSLFSSQVGRTYFSLEVGDWVIVALDSAYYDPSSLYMDGAIYDSKGGQEQVAFLKEQAALGKQLLLLTHHNGLEYDGSNINPTLWNQVITEALDGKAPDAWYWGHVHNGIVYENSLPVLEGLKSIHGNDPKMRCCGHASIPYGKATGLFDKATGQTIPGIAYFGETAMDASNPTPSQHLRVLNGFAVVEISGSTFNETFYEVSNNYDVPKAVWSS